MKTETPRFERERKTLQTMIGLYCHDLHAPEGNLCGDCTTLQDYALAHLERCTFGADKPKCSDCPVHCYKPAMREAIRTVMKYAGPRMLLKHPVMALCHAADGLGSIPGRPERLHS